MITPNRGRYYGKAQNQVRRLRAAYDESSGPLRSAPDAHNADEGAAIAAKRCAVVALFAAFVEFLVNAPSLDVTHHPAMTLPCGAIGGLPIGMMLVAKHFDESFIYRAAHAFEQASAQIC